MTLLDRVRACHRWNPAEYRPLRLRGRPIGRVEPALREALLDFPERFRPDGAGVALIPEPAGADATGAAVEAVLAALRPSGLVGRRRTECYAVAPVFGERLLWVDRGAVPPLGVRGYGIHVNGFVREGERLLMWIGKRAKDKATAPGKLDQMVAGGQPDGLGVAENLAKECAEEAGLTAEQVARARPVGTLAYCCRRQEGLRDDLIFAYDLELPADFEPVNTDGEIERFELMPFETVLERVAETDDFKFNCALVIVDFAVRHGVLAPDDPDYHEIVEGLHRPAED